MSFGGHVVVIPSLTAVCFMNLCACGKQQYQLLFFILSFSFLLIPGTHINSSEERRTLNWGCGGTVQVQECSC
jgi:hypothetical protein